MMSDHTESARVTASDSPIAFTATTLTFTELDGPLPVVAISHVVPAHSVAFTTTPPDRVVTRYEVMGELLDGPAFQRIMMVLSPNPLGPRLETGSGLSCTEITTLPQT